MSLPYDVYKIEGQNSGPTIAIFAGVHGNERAGVYALHEILPSLTVAKGSVYLVFANPPAIDQNIRMLNKNLNRCFVKNNTGTDPEDLRARELMQLLDECDALLDLHMFYDEEGKPFVICEENAIDVAKKFDVDIISTNWTEVEPGGTDGYMYLRGKIGICVECGPIFKADQYVEFAKRTVFQFLKHYGMTDETVSYSNSAKRIVRADKAVLKTSDDFVLKPGLRNFQRLNPGQLLAVDSKAVFKAKEDQCIIFPHYQARVDEEAYIIGTELSYE